MYINMGRWSPSNHCFVGALKAYNETVDHPIQVPSWMEKETVFQVFRNTENFFHWVRSNVPSGSVRVIRTRRGLYHAMFQIPGSDLAVDNDGWCSVNELSMYGELVC